MKTAGWSTPRVAGQVDRSDCAVRNCWEHRTREGTHARKTGSVRPGRPRTLVDPTVTRSTIRADAGVAIVPQTISRHLAEANLKSKRLFRALPLTPEHRELRLHWCQARSMWNVTDWQKVVFSDESRFVLGTDDNRVRVWRRPGKQYNSPHTILRHTARTASVMVWGVIAYESRSTLIVMRGILTGQRYVDDILRPHVGPFLNGLPGPIFQQDNARPHTARVAQDFLRHFQTLPGPACSPNLSPVDRVWDQLKRQMPSYHSVHDLDMAVQDLWAHLPQDYIRCLINSMTDRVVACIAAVVGIKENIKTTGRKREKMRDTTTAKKKKSVALHKSFRYSFPQMAGCGGDDNLMNALLNSVGIVAEGDPYKLNRWMDHISGKCSFVQQKQTRMYCVLSFVSFLSVSCQVIYSQFGLAIHQNDHQARRRFVEWAQNEIAVLPDFHKRILFSDEAHFWLNGYVNKQNCRIWSEATPQVYVETPLHREKLTIWCALWAGGIIVPYFFKIDEDHNVTVNCDRYRAMITNLFIPELNNHDVQELWFQQDGATCHTARAPIDLLKDTFGDRIISRF
ncbi:transposable element Tc3 transposase [Trichonephila clavipes]|nr:transposable element Tc3 transposase [Trichonephila clavipes]